MIKQISKEVAAIHFKKFGSIVYLLQPTINNKKINILIDTSSKENKKELILSLKSLGLTPKNIDIIILTHAHYDHVENLDLFPNTKIYGNFNKIINPNHTQTEESKILPISHLQTTAYNLQIFSTPGHTPGDIIILYKNILFSGDFIFNGGYIGRNNFPESNPKEQEKSLKILSKLKFNILCPGH